MRRAGIRCQRCGGFGLPEADPDIEVVCLLCGETLRDTVLNANGDPPIADGALNQAGPSARATHHRSGAWPEYHGWGDTRVGSAD